MPRFRHVKRALPLLPIAWALSAVPTFAQESPAPDLKINEVTYDAQRRVGVPRPAGWEYRDLETLPTSDDPVAAFDVMRFVARTELFGDIRVKIVMLNACAQSDRLQAVYERGGKIANGEAEPDEYHLEFEPVVHGWFRHKGDPDGATVIAHRRANGRSMSVVFVLDAELLDEARPTLVEVARQTVVDMPLWPPRPDGYEFEEAEPGIALAFGDRIDSRTRRDLRKLVRETVEAFEKEHGEHGYQEELPLEVYFDHDQQRRGAAVLGIQEVPVARAITVCRRVASVVARSSDDRARFARELFEGLWDSKYPVSGCRWLMIGEQHLAWMREKCGKPIPWVPPDSLRGLKLVRLDLAQMVATPNQIEWQDAGTWVAFFRLASR